MEQRQDRPQWKLAKLFTHDEQLLLSGPRYAVRVSKLDQGYPRYSIMVGALVPPRIEAEHNGVARPAAIPFDVNTWRFVNHINLVYTTNNGVAMPDNAIEKINALLVLARGWITSEVQRHTDEFIERKQSREMRDISRGAPVTAHTGKTAKAKAKAASK